MTHAHASSLAQRADAELKRALGGRPLVTFDRFTSAGRTSGLGPFAVQSAQPSLSVGYYSTWAAAHSGQIVLAAEERVGRRDGKAKHRWLDNLTGDLLRSCAEFRAQPLFAAWYTSPVMQGLARDAGATILTVPSSVRAGLEDKTRLNDLLQSAGVLRKLHIPAMISEGLVTYKEAVSQLGQRLVVQSAITSGGRGTVFVDDRLAFEHAFSQAGPWRISRYIEGFSSNTTVLTLPTPVGCQVYVDAPSHKPVGIASIGIAPAKGAGNDWSPPWPRMAVATLVEAIVQLGTQLYNQYGLVGLWGVDSIFAGDAVMINEINVRNQGTSELSGVNQQLRGLPSLTVAHLTVLAGGTVSWLPQADEFNHNTVTRSAEGGLAPFYLKLRNRHSYAVQARPDWEGPGIYRFSNSGLAWLRPGAHPADAHLDCGELLLANGPRAGVVCMPGAELGTVEGLTTKPLFGGPTQLSSLGTQVHSSAEKMFELIKTESDRP